MNGKPVIEIESRVLNMKSGFAPKLLCDGPTFTAGTSCPYSCSFCYVPAIMSKSGHVPEGKKHEDLVVRRARPVEVLRGQLTDTKGRPKYLSPDDRRVIYASPLVDVAANMELVAETVEMCKVILTLTNWDIRLLSKSNLLPKIAKALYDWDHDEWKEHGRANHGTYSAQRVIYGVSTGTFDDRVAAAIEAGTPKVSKRIESLHWLQDHGYRTFAMVCPSLPQFDYNDFAVQASDSLRYDRCEHVWAEVINLRGESFTRTHKSLLDAGLNASADMVHAVSHEKELWEGYARETYNAHAAVVPPGKLRFLQYVNKSNEVFWNGKPGVVKL